MMRRIVLPVLFPVLLLVVFAQCSTLLDSKEPDDKIVVVADSVEWIELKPYLEATFSTPMHTPQPEPWFTLEWVKPEAMESVDLARNIFYVSTLDANHKMAEFMRVSIDPTAEGLVREGKQYAFVKKDFHARNQTVVFMAAETMDQLQNAIVRESPQLLYFFKHAWEQREELLVRYADRQEDLEQRFLEDYGWTLCIPKAWFVGKDSSELNVVWLRRKVPVDTERWLLVHWIDNASPAMLTGETVLDMRDSLTEILYRTVDDSAWVQIDRENYLQVETDNFLGHYAIRVQGLWRMSDRSMGGPFMTYVFLDTLSQRLYMLDGSVFAPGYEKKKLILDTDAMLHTFSYRQVTATENTASQRNP